MKNFEVYYPNNNIDNIIKEISVKKHSKSQKKPLGRIKIIFNFRRIVNKIVEGLSKNKKLSKMQKINKIKRNIEKIKTNRQSLFFDNFNSNFKTQRHSIPTNVEKKFL